jgi:hypothetical protein
MNNQAGKRDIAIDVDQTAPLSRSCLVVEPGRTSVAKPPNAITKNDANAAYVTWFQRLIPSVIRHSDFE